MLFYLSDSIVRKPILIILFENLFKLFASVSTLKATLVNYFYPSSHQSHHPHPHPHHRQTNKQNKHETEDTSNEAALQQTAHTMTTQAPSKSNVTDIEFLSKTRAVYTDELSYAGRGLKFNTAADIRPLVDEIRALATMRVLRLEGNTISPEAAEELGTALRMHPELERFIGNDIFTGRLKDEIPLALRSMCGAMDVCGSRLVEINMSDNAFGPIGLEALVQFFQSACCFSLKEIRMHNNGLGPEGAKKFAHALEQCWRNSDGALQLRVFICGRNRLELDGSRAIANTLKLIGSLEEIQMPQNGIRPTGIEFVAEAFAHNKQLRIINMNDNTFRKIGGEWMAKVAHFRK